MLQTFRTLITKPVILYPFLALIGAALQILIFFPGAFTNDSFAILAQAKGMNALSDWHPPIMALIWHLLLPFGDVFPMLLVQVVMYWTPLTILALTLHKYSRSYTGPLLILFLGLTPPFLADSGMIWKDNHVTYSLLISTVLTLSVALHLKKSRKYRTVLLATSALFLVYALLLRHNILPAVAPLAIYLFWTWNQSTFTVKNIRRIALQCVALLFVGMILIPGIISSVFNVIPQHSSSQVMSDDLVSLLSQEEIRALDTDDATKGFLLRVNGQCEPLTVMTDTLWRCNDTDEVQQCRAIKATDRTYTEACNNFEAIQALYRDDARALPRTWLSVISQKPYEYLRHRAKLYASFMFPKESYIWHPGQTGTTTTEAGVTVQITPPRDSWLRKTYGDFTRYTVDTMQVFYMPGIAIMLSLIITYYAHTRRSRLGEWVNVFYAIFASITLYTFSYFPVVLVNSYRFTYWTTIAMYLSLALIVVLLKQNPAKPPRASTASRRSLSKNT